MKTYFLQPNFRFGEKINFVEIRKRIYEGKPIADLDSYGLAQIPEDVFIIHLGNENVVLPFAEVDTFEHAQEQKLEDKLENSNGRMKYFWEKVKQKTKEPIKYVGGVIGLDQALSVASNVKENIAGVTNTINDRVDQSFDKLNEKIKNLSFSEIDDMVEKEVANTQDQNSVPNNQSLENASEETGNSNFTNYDYTDEHLNDNNDADDIDNDNTYDSDSYDDVDDIDIDIDDVNI